MSTGTDWPASAVAHVSASLQGGRPPFSLCYDGVPGPGPDWETSDSEAGRCYRLGDLSVRLDIAEFAAHHAVRWIPWYGWDDGADSGILSDVLSLDLTLPVSGDVTVYHARGARQRASDFEPLVRTVHRNVQLSYQPGGGRSSNQYLPFFTVDLGDGHGFVLAAGWTGEWRVEFSHTADGLRVTLGVDRTHFRLDPGETVRGPSCWLQFWSGDRISAENAFRRLVLEHARPLVNGFPVVAPLSAVTWGATRAAVHTEVLDQILAERIPFEVYWIDAGWFDASKDWSTSVGSWQLDRTAYPDGLKPLSDRLHALGKRLALWVEPERITAGSAWSKLDPGWLLTIEGDDSLIGHLPESEIGPWLDARAADPASAAVDSLLPRMHAGDMVLNLANPEACDFLIEFVSRLITEHGLDCYRQDSNFATYRFWAENEAPDRVGLLQLRYIGGLYRFWDTLLARFPHLTIDNCAQGGRRIDIETMQRATPLSRTDYVFSVTANEMHTPALLRWVPLNAQIVPCPLTAREVRGGFSSGLSIGWGNAYNVPEESGLPTDFPFTEIRAELDRYLELRPLYYGDFAPLLDPSLSEQSWTAYQLHRGDLGAGAIVIAVRRDSPHTEATFRLRYLDEDACYQFGAEAEPRAGRELMTDGLRVSAGRAGLILRYRQAG